MPNNQDIPRIAAMISRYSITDIIAAYKNGVSLRFYYFPDGKHGQRKLFSGIPSPEDCNTARILIGGLLGRCEVETRRIDTEHNHPAPDIRSKVGEIVQGYEKIQSYKWTTDQFTRKPIPPNSFVWRDIHTGKISVVNPFIEEVV